MHEPTEINVWGYQSGCPACDSLKAVLASYSVPYTFWAIDPAGEAREALREAGYATVPQAFMLDGTHIGDYQSIKQALNKAFADL